MHTETSHSEKQLLKLAAQGDEKSFTELFHTYKHKLYGFLIRITESPEMTEDIIQEIFLKLWKDRHGLDEIDNLGGYVYRMGQNQAINAFKRIAKETVILAELQKQTVFSPSQAEDNLALKDTQEKINKALELLSPQQKLVFSLSREQGLKYDEIATELKISPSTVRNHMIQALKVIRENLASQINAGDLTSLLLIVSLLFKKNL